MKERLTSADLRVRRYGESGPEVLLLHGGPGAAGYMAPVALGLADSFRVLEPFQRASGHTPLTVARHVDDLHQVINSHCADTRPAIVGHSWGAMLALAGAAAYPAQVGRIVLVGCGTFDPAARTRLSETLAERMTEDIEKRLADLSQECKDPDRRLGIMGKLIEPLYSFDHVPGADEAQECDARAHTETWNDMLRLQENGTYPAAFASITSRVIMMHGTFDPHPGRMILAGLKPYIPHLEYKEWERCGHYPWREKHVRDEFHAALKAWLSGHCD